MSRLTGTLPVALLLLAACTHARHVAARPAALPASPPPSAATPTPSATPNAFGGLILHGSRTSPEIALTFDADMTPGMRRRFLAGESFLDARILATLRATDTPATIFATGLWAESYAPTIRVLTADPLFEVENHSFDHAAFEPHCYRLRALTSAGAKRDEVSKAGAVLTPLIGRAPRFFRFPGGCASSADVRLVLAQGETPVGWDVNSADAYNHSAAAIEANVLSQVRDGSIIIMHLIGAPNAPATSVALARIIPLLKARGFRFVTLEHLLGGIATA